jgi:hypothetical protein
MFRDERILLRRCVNRQGCSLIPRQKVMSPKHRFFNNTTDAAVTGWRRCHPCAEAMFGRKQERSMPTYFFEIHNGVPVRDPTGLHFKSDLVAIRRSRSIASRFRRDGRLAGHALFVVVRKIGGAQPGNLEAEWGCGAFARNRRFAQACSDRVGDRQLVHPGWNDIGAESGRLGGCATHVQPGWNRNSCHRPSLPTERVFRRTLEGHFCISLGLELKVRPKLRLEGSSAD